jgi:hypothetical protein
MNYVKELIHTMPSDELRANVKVCLDHSCAIFSGNYQGFSASEETYIKGIISREPCEPTEDDLEFKAIFQVFQKTMNATHSLWHNIKSPIRILKSKLTPLTSVILGTIQAIELSEVPSILPPLFEALVTGQWKTFILSAVGLMSPSGMKMEVIGDIVMYLVGDEDFLEWCKREVVIQSRSQPDYGAI